GGADASVGLSHGKSGCRLGALMASFPGGRVSSVSGPETNDERALATLSAGMTYAVDASPPFYHGTRADLRVGDLLAPGFNSNYGERKLSWIYFSGTLDAAIWGCE